MTLSRVCECRICGKEELTNKALLPDGWALLWDVSAIVCDGCLAVWGKRFGEVPVIYMQGGVKEPTLF